MDKYTPVWPDLWAPPLRLLMTDAFKDVRFAGVFLLRPGFQVSSRLEMSAAGAPCLCSYASSHLLVQEDLADAS